LAQLVAISDHANSPLVVKSIIASIHNPTLGKDKPTLCLTCDTAFTPTSQPPEAFVVLKGASPDAQHLIINVLCAPCDQHPNAKQRVFDKIRWGMIQEAREIHTEEAGHA
jgi:hypothetical protein